MDQDTVTIVSGLPRSGTSMMMRMLEVGGVPVLTDRIRTADEDNPQGYYEFERVKQIEQDQAWLEDSRGKAVKMIAALLKHLPATFRYNVIFMRRDLKEILASQRQMLVRRGEPADTISDEQMAALFARHLKRVEAWLNAQPNVDVLYVDYNQMLSAPAAHAAQVNRFLGGNLDLDRMIAVVEPSLYRQRQHSDG